MDSKVIGVLGLGYVGIVNVACLSKLGHTVYCNDVKLQKVAAVRAGRSPINEPGVTEAIETGIKAGHIIPSDDAKEVIAKADVIITCVGTPSRASGEVNLAYLRNVMKDIRDVLDKADKKFIVCRSTVPPGTTSAVYEEFFADDYPHVKPVFYPEFLREGSAMDDFYDYGRFVLGHREGEDVDALVDLLHVNKARPSYLTDLATAEYAKYVDNSFHALKIVFANEVFGLGAKLGVDIEQAHQIFVADDKLNVSKRYLRPGMPFGGSCLPKDLRELQHLIAVDGGDYNLLQSMIPSNDAYVNRLVQELAPHKGKRIGFIGLSFKNDSDDLRESPVLRILQTLEKLGGYAMSIWDEDLHADNLRIDFPALYALLSSWEDMMANAEVLVVSKRYLSKVLSANPDVEAVINWSDSLFERSNSSHDMKSLYS